MRKIPATEFKARCHKLLDEVHSTREPLLITKRGKPIAKLVPAGKPGKFIGSLKGVFRIVGDIEAPIDGDFERINRAADQLNAEALDVLEYQATKK